MSGILLNILSAPNSNSSTATKRPATGDATDSSTETKRHKRCILYVVLIVCFALPFYNCFYLLCFYLYNRFIETASA